MPPLALVWDLIAKDNASPAFTRVGAAADKAAAQTEAAQSRMAGALTKIATGAAVAGVGFAAVSVKMAMDFQAAMLQVQTQAGASASEIKKMTPAILSLAGKTAQAPEELATSLYHVESVGLRGAKALDVVAAAAKFATVAHANLEDTTNALTATVASGIPGIKNMDQAIGMLNATVGSGDMKLQDLNQALGSGLLTVVKGYGLNMRDVSAALATFGDNNIRGADAATMLRMAVQSMAVPAKTGKKALEELGLTSSTLAKDMQTGGLNKAITDLNDHIHKAGISGVEVGSLLTQAFGKKAGPGVAVLSAQFDRLQTKYADVNKATNTFGQEWEATTKSAAFNAQAFDESLKALAISFGNTLLPAVTEAMQWLTQKGIPDLQAFGSAVGDVIDWFKGLPSPIQNVALTLVGLRIADHIGLFDRLGSTVGGLRTAFAGFRDEIALQQTLWAMNERSITSAGRGYSEVGSILSTTQGSLQAASAGVGRFGATLSTLSARSLPALKAAGTSVMNLFGGPWGVALGAAVLVLPTFIDGIKQMTGHVIDATAAQQGFTQSLLATNGVMDQSIRKDIQQALLKANLADTFRAAGISARDAIDGIAGNAAAQERVNKALQAYILANPGTVHNKVATAAMNARNAFNQLTTAFGGSVAAAKYFAGSADTATHKTDGATASVKSLTAAIHALPDGHVSVTADTGPAVRSINDMLATYRSQVINLRAAMPQIPGVQRLGTYASGGYTGPGSKYTPAGIVHANEFVFPSEAVNRLGTSFLGALAGLPGYASGGLVGGMDVGTIRTSVNMDTSGVSGPLAAMIASLKAALVPAVGPIGSGVERWRGTVDAVLRALGQSLSLDNGILSLISHESGGNPGAINLTDSNARAGHPSQGLMQTIPSTFYAYAGPYASRGILDPFANIYAGTNYALNRYGAGMLLQGGNHVGGKYVGYEKGTPFVPSDGLAYLHKGEAVIPAKHNRGGGTTITLQLDRMAVTDLLEGRIVTALDGLTARGDYNP